MKSRTTSARSVLDGPREVSIRHFENFTTFTPRDHHATALGTLLDQVLAWSTALAPLRRPAIDTPNIDPEGIDHDDSARLSVTR
ncbi:hypothetical protein AB0H42_26765 [Nocardia sp. NPDC050799]|uniref:hypothetical protein n=1 Tax=Nocardia sp. NPDC050799 TaxID=3154842 RepID=UPI0034029887